MQINTGKDNLLSGNAQQCWVPGFLDLLFNPSVSLKLPRRAPSRRAALVRRALGKRVEAEAGMSAGCALRAGVLQMRRSLQSERRPWVKQRRTNIAEKQHTALCTPNATPDLPAALRPTRGQDAAPRAHRRRSPPRSPQSARAPLAGRRAGALAGSPPARTALCDQQLGYGRICMVGTGPSPSPHPGEGAWHNPGPERDDRALAMSLCRENSLIK